jgi:hypothetical protein
MGNPTTVVAERFLLTDSNGTVRAVLGVNEQGEVMFGLSDARGNIRADVSVTADGLPRVELCDSAGNTRALMCVDEQDAPAITLFDSGMVRLALSVNAEGPFVTLTDEQSRRQVTLMATRDAALALFQDPGGRATVTAGLGTNQTDGFFVSGPGEASRIQLALCGDGTAGLAVSDPAGTITTVP